MYLRSLGWEAPVVIPRSGYPLVQSVVELLLPGQEVIIYDPDTECIRASKVVLPGMLQNDYVLHESFLFSADRILENVATSPASPTAIFVSRSRLRGKFRSCANAEQVEELAAKRGIAIIHPQELAWTDQIRLFRHTRLIVGEFGSGVHNALFSRSGTTIICLNYLNHVQSRIGNARGHNMGFVLDPDGQPRKMVLNWTEQQTFKIDLNSFNSALDIAQTWIS
jgi:capsular polysaccharide biosynthesis protein